MKNKKGKCNPLRDKAFMMELPVVPKTARPLSYHFH